MLVPFKVLGLDQEQASFYSQGTNFLVRGHRLGQTDDTYLNPVSTRTVLVLFCFYILNIEIILGRICFKSLETN